MERDDTLLEIIEAIIPLLSKSENHHWVKIFEGLIKQYAFDEIEIKRHIRNLYGGMGSFNDLILQDQRGNLLITENIRLDKLKGELYKLSQLEK